MGCPMACTVKEPCMPKYDVYHEPVKRALIKDGWTILMTRMSFHTKDYDSMQILVQKNQ